ncbi:MAG TPA: pyridoxamine 5'-phosphate oxidase family protein [Longimicrobiaceae bacterium]
MGKVFENITPELQAFIEAQPVFFVASAPLSRDGHVNLSPKGLDSLRVLSPVQVAYLDLTGSGNETAAHLTENGRITLMFCAFDGPPRVLRLYGRGRVVLPGDPSWPELAERFPSYPGTRQIIVTDISRVQTSCGFGVPRLSLVEQRDTLIRWAEAKGEKLTEYRLKNNSRSIDGLPAPLAPKP